LATHSPSADAKLEHASDVLVVGLDVNLPHTPHLDDLGLTANESRRCGRRGRAAASNIKTIMIRFIVTSFAAPPKRGVS
jgi:hypothetical protein